MAIGIVLFAAVSFNRCEADERLTAALADEWYDAQPLLVGCNYLP